MRGGFSDRLDEMRDRRHHDLERPDPVPEELNRAGEHSQQPRDFARAAARQHEQDGRRLEPAARLLCIRTQVAHLPRQGMTHIGAGRPAQPPVSLGLERQQGQDVIDKAAQHTRATRPPGPDRRRYIFHDRDRGVRGPHPACDPQREVRTVDDHQHIRTARHHGLGGRADAAQNVGDAARERTEPDDR